MTRTPGQPLPISGTHNLRDLGGYRTQDGLPVRGATLYRSGHLARLSWRGRRALKRLGLRLVIDLRSETERAAMPDRLPDPAPRVEVIPLAAPDFDFDGLRRKILTGRMGGTDGYELLRAEYRAYALERRAPLRRIFQLIRRPESRPLLFHCTAGKDRTGVVAALLLTALGVPRRGVFEDFRATGPALRRVVRRSVWLARLASGFRADIEQLRALAETRPELLELFWSTAKAQWGSVEGLLDQIGVDAPARDQLRAELCGPA